MYEIWLALNIVYEIALSIWPTLLVLLLAWLALLATAGGRLNARALCRALLPGAVATVILLISIPSLTQSSLANMGYWVDWANVLAIALGLGTLVVLFVWPLMALLCPRCRSAE